MQYSDIFTGGQIDELGSHGAVLCRRTLFRPFRKHREAEEDTGREQREEHAGHGKSGPAELEGGNEGENQRRPYANQPKMRHIVHALDQQGGEGQKAYGSACESQNPLERPYFLTVFILSHKIEVCQ